MTSTPDRDAAACERFRAYLKMLAEVRLPAYAVGKLDASDLVQQTLARAVEGWGELRAVDDAQIAAWLRKILANQLANALRDLRRDRRDVARERSIEQSLDESSARMEGWLASPQTSPSLRAVRGEQLLEVAAALAQLPDAQRQAVALYHLGDRPLNEIAEQMERSPAAVAGLIKRGLKGLREKLAADGSRP